MENSEWRRKALEAQAEEDAPKRGIEPNPVTDVAYSGEGTYEDSTPELEEKIYDLWLKAWREDDIASWLSADPRFVAAAVRRLRKKIRRDESAEGREEHRDRLMGVSYDVLKKSLVHLNSQWSNENAKLVLDVMTRLAKLVGADAEKRVDMSVTNKTPPRTMDELTQMAIQAGVPPEMIGLAVGRPGRPASDEKTADVG